MRAYEFLHEQSVDQNLDEQNPKANAKALTGSGLGGNTKKPNCDSSDHKKHYPPSTNYSKSRRKYNAGAKPGANDGFVG